MVAAPDTKRRRFSLAGAKLSGFVPVCVALDNGDSRNAPDRLFAANRIECPTHCGALLLPGGKRCSRGSRHCFAGRPSCDLDHRTRRTRAVRRPVSSCYRRSSPHRVRDLAAPRRVSQGTAADPGSSDRSAADRCRRYIPRGRQLWAQALEPVMKDDSANPYYQWIAGGSPDTGHQP